MRTEISFKGRLAGFLMILAAGLSASLVTAVMLGAGDRPAPPTEQAGTSAKGGKGAARYGAGMAFVEKGEFAPALKEFDEAKRLERNDADILSMHAFCLRKLGRIEEAREGYHAALKLRAKFPEAREHLGEAYLQLAREQLEILRSYGPEAKNEATELATAIKALASEIEKK